MTKQEIQSQVKEILDALDHGHPVIASHGASLLLQSLDRDVAAEQKAHDAFLRGEDIKAEKARDWVLSELDDFKSEKARDWVLSELKGWVDHAVMAGEKALLWAAIRVIEGQAPRGSPVVCVGMHTIDRLMAGQEVDCGSAMLIPASDLTHVRTQPLRAEPPRLILEFGPGGAVTIRPEIA